MKNYNVKIRSSMGGSNYSKVQPIKELLNDLVIGNMEVYEAWMNTDEIYDPINFKVSGIRFNKNMEATEIVLKVESRDQK